MQQGLSHTGAIYGLRSVARSRHASGSLPGEDLTHPAVQATIAAGLRPKALNKAELVRFRANTGDYLDARQGSMFLADLQRRSRRCRVVFRSCRELVSVTGRTPLLMRRNLILLKWNEDVTRFLTEDDCVGM